MITKDDYDNWRKNVVTEKLFSALKDIRDEIQLNMTNENIIMGEDCQKTLVRQLGMLAGLDLVLNMECDELIDEEEEVITDNLENFY